MSRLCSITGAKPVKGHRILRSGKSKKSGGIGMHVTANTKRTFVPNLKEKRIYVPELKRFMMVKLTARALKTVTKNGAFSTLKKAGIIKMNKNDSGYSVKKKAGTIKMKKSGTNKK